MWGPTDGNMIAADAHYNQLRAEDYFSCEQCGRDFDAEDPPGDLVSQHPVIFTLCQGCAEMLEDR